MKKYQSEIFLEFKQIYKKIGKEEGKKVDQPVFVISQNAKKSRIKKGHSDSVTCVSSSLPLQNYAVSEYG